MRALNLIAKLIVKINLKHNNNGKALFDFSRVQYKTRSKYD